jgi:hypothetical protein
MKFFLPDWDDRVDPGFDFKTERPTLDRIPQDDFYAHEMFGDNDKVYDGILVSRMALGEKGRKREAANESGLREYLRLPDEYELMGDCGAFGYVSKERPPFTTPEIIDYYKQMRFDLAISIDHIVLPEFSDQNKFRYQLTIDNALEFLKLSKRRKVDFTPIGALQGWDTESYVKSAEILTAAGYEYVAIGGLARSPNPVVLDICTAVAGAVPGIKIHVFGVARSNIASAFAKLGIESADSASPLRQAWLSAKDNYYTPDRTYAAIRIPVTNEQRAKNKSPSNSSSESYSDLKSAEKEALTALRGYAKREVGYRKTLKAIVEYDSMLGDRKYADNGKKRHALYVETLKERPWQKCECQICRALGVEVIIFRGSNRNRRRGFHNLWTLRQRMFNVQIPLID